MTYKHGIYSFPHKLPNDVRIMNLGNIRKVSKLHKILIAKIKILLVLAKRPKK